MGDREHGLPQVFHPQRHLRGRERARAAGVERGRGVKGEESEGLSVGGRTGGWEGGGGGGEREKVRERERE